MPRDYSYDQGFSQQRMRPAGIGAGWRCLEVGVGGGSLATYRARSIDFLPFTRSL